MSKIEKIEKLVEALERLKDVFVAELEEEKKKSLPPVIRVVAVTREEKEPQPTAPPAEEKKVQMVAEPVAPKNELELGPQFEELKKLLFSDQWPIAVPRELICDESSEEDKKERADGIIDLIVNDSVQNKTFLDFGCGEGHLPVSAASRQAKMAVGYDIKESGVLKWETREQATNCLLTTNWNKVLEHAPYDTILLYDVLDHLASQEEMHEVMRKIKAIKSPKGKVYVRCHPFCNRHGGHLYKKINKALIHLVFSEDELKALGCPLEIQCLKLMHPAFIYRQVFEKTGFKKLSEEIINEMPEEFFMKNPLVRPRIQKFWKTSTEEKLKTGKVFPGFQTGMSFVDFVLE